MKQKVKFREDMKRDLMRVFREVSAQYECRNNTEAFRKVVNHPAPRFYVTVASAHSVISPMRYGDRSRLETMTPLKREMYEDLFNVVVGLSREERFQGKTLHYILRFAIMEPAPKFYINVRRMEQIWHERTKLTRRQLYEKTIGDEKDNR